MSTPYAKHADLTIRLIPGGWVIDKDLHRLPGVYESMATAMLARGLSDADRKALHGAASAATCGTGAIRYEAVWGNINGTNNPRVLKIVAERRKRSELDLSENSEHQDV